MLAATAAYMLQLPQKDARAVTASSHVCLPMGSCTLAGCLPNMRSSAVMWHAACACLSIAV